MLEELQFGFPLLSVLLFLPLLGAVTLWVQRDADLMRKSALGVAVLELSLAIILMVRFIPESAAMQFSERLNWIPPLGISYHLAVDGISVAFVGLSAFITLLIILYSWDAVRENVKPYFMSILALETTMIGIFVSIDLILFFVFWELMLVPSYFLIKLWGVGNEKEYAALKYVLYTLLGSVFMLVGFALLSLNYYDVRQTYSFDLLDLLTVAVPVDEQLLIFWLIFMGLAFKAPVFPFHTWLPDALVHGPIGMSVVLAGIKLGTYGFLRFSFPLLPEASTNETVVVIVMILALAAIVWGAIIAVMQTDFKRLLAFSSISHLGFVVLGLFALNFQGVQGSLLHMINLGLTTAGLFFLAGFLHDRLGNTLLEHCGGMASKMPWLATFVLIVGMALDRTPRDERLRRRISDPARRVSIALALRGRGGVRRDFRRRVFSLVLRASHVWPRRLKNSRRPEGPDATGIDDCRGSVRDDYLDRALSLTVFAHDERIGAGGGGSIGSRVGRERGTRPDAAVSRHER